MDGPQGRMERERGSHSVTGFALDKLPLPTAPGVEVRSPKARTKGHCHPIRQGRSVGMGPRFRSAKESPSPGRTIPSLQGPQAVGSVEEEKRPFPECTP